MKRHIRAYWKIVAILIVFILCTVLLIFYSGRHCYIKEKKITIVPEPKSIKINFDEALYQNIIDHPETRKVKLTLVTLQPGEKRPDLKAGSTEVMIIAINGKGIVNIYGKEEKNMMLNLSTEEIVYCPSKTELSVSNNSDEVLKYLFIRIG